MYTDGPREPIHFKHGITRDVIYSLLGLERRRGLHLRAAEAIEAEVTAEQLEEYYEALTYHYRCADSVEQAITYAVLAADKARVRAALDSARLHYQSALDLLDRLEQGPAIEARRSSICRHWALVCMYGPAAGQVERFKQQVAYAQETGDEEAAARGRYFVGYLCYTLGRHNEARTELMLAYQLAARLNMSQSVRRDCRRARPQCRARAATTPKRSRISMAPSNCGPPNLRRAACRWARLIP